MNPVCFVTTFSFFKIHFNIIFAYTRKSPIFVFRFRFSEYNFVPCKAWILEYVTRQSPLVTLCATRFNICTISTTYPQCVRWNSGFLRCGAASLDEWFPTFRRKMASSSSSVKQSMKNILFMFFV